jgi:hypothetical protein
MLLRRHAHLFIASLFTILVALPAAAATNVVHTTIPVNETFTLQLGPEARCLGVPQGTTATAHYTGEIKQTEFVSGPNAGRIHVQERDVFTFTIPSTGAGGRARETVHVIVKNDDTVSFMNVVHMQGTLPDGTPFKVTFHVHVVVQQGEVKVDMVKVNCVKP